MKIDPDDERQSHSNGSVPSLATYDSIQGNVGILKTLKEKGEKVWGGGSLVETSR